MFYFYQNNVIAVSYFLFSFFFIHVQILVSMNLRAQVATGYHSTSQGHDTFHLQVLHVGYFQICG